MSLGRDRWRHRSIGRGAPLTRCRMACLDSGRLSLLLAPLHPGRDEVADRHVEVEEHPDHEENEEDGPRPDLTNRATKGRAHRPADRPTAVAGVDEVSPTAGGQVEHSEQREGDDARPGRCHQALGRQRLHPQHQREPGQQRAGKGDSPAEQASQQVMPGLHEHARMGRKDRNDAHDGQDQQDKGADLPPEPCAAEHAGAPSPPRAPAATGPGRASTRHAQTSVTMGRIIGRRFVRSKK